MIEELSVPLRDVVNYEEHVNDDSDMYQKLLWAERQINSSLDEIQDMVHNLMLYCTIAIYIALSHVTVNKHIIIDILYVTCSKIVICWQNSYHFSTVKIHNQVTLPRGVVRYIHHINWVFIIIDIMYEQGRCDSLVNNSVDEYRDLIELYIGLTFTVRDLLDIGHDLDQHYPH